MGACTIIGTPKVGPSGLADENVSHGEFSLSASVAAGGDTLDPSILGLGTLDRLILGLPRLVSGAAVTTIIFPTVRTALPQRTPTFGGSGQVKIQAFTATSSEFTGDGSIYAIPYVAYGA